MSPRSGKEQSLPIASRNRQLEKNSIALFIQTLPDCVHHSPNEDYGWDFFTELAMPVTRGTQRRARDRYVLPAGFFVQLKASEALANKRTVSVRLKASTLRYLLGQPMPTLLVVYDPIGTKGEETLYVTWLHDATNGKEGRISGNKSLTIRLSRNETEHMPGTEKLFRDVLLYRGFELDSQGCPVAPTGTQFNLLRSAWQTHFGAPSNDLGQDTSGGRPSQRGQSDLGPTTLPVVGNPTDAHTNIPEGISGFYQFNSRNRKFFLHQKTVVLRGGRKQRIFYFSDVGKIVAEHLIDAVPHEYMVSENPRTGMLILKKKA